MNASHSTLQECEVAIIGGGMVGAAMAGALRASGLRIALVEAAPARDREPAPDARAIALAYGTRRILQGMDAWTSIAAVATPIERIHVSQRGAFGVTRLSCRQAGVEALGYVVRADELHERLWNTVAECRAITILQPAQVTDLEQDDAAVTLHLQHDGTPSTLRARVAIAADGARSALRARLGIDAEQADYGQIAVTAQVETERFHDHTAYERFTPSGPIAFLPMRDGRCGVVWTHREREAAATLALDDAQFLAQLQEQFGGRLGRLCGVGPRSAYPLVTVRARRAGRGRVVLAGNAAHTLHPIAGQGLNLGMRDVAVLAELIAAAAARGEDVGGAALLHAYESRRRADQRRVMQFTNGLNALFSNDLPPLRWARAAGLFAFERMPPAKRYLAWHAMGLAGRQPALACGLRSRRAQPGV